MEMGNCCQRTQSYDVVRYNVGQPENVQTLHSYGGETRSGSKEPESMQKTLAPDNTFNTQAISNNSDVDSPNGTCSSQDKSTKSKIEEDDRSEESAQLRTSKVPTKRPNSRKSALVVRDIAAIPEYNIVTALAREPIRKEKIICESGQMAAPSPAKRTISVEAKSTGFIVDVPQMEGLGPDGTFLVTFNKMELNDR